MKKNLYIVPEMTMIATDGADVVTLSYVASYNGDNIRYNEGKAL